MDWKEWIGKNVFVQLEKGGTYSGKIIDIEINDIGINYDPLTFITLIDKFGKKVFFSTSQIIKLVDESDDRR